MDKFGFEHKSLSLVKWRSPLGRQLGGGWMPASGKTFLTSFHFVLPNPLLDAGSRGFEATTKADIMRCLPN